MRKRNVKIVERVIVREKEAHDEVGPISKVPEKKDKRVLVRKNPRYNWKSGRWFVSSKKRWIHFPEREMKHGQSACKEERDRTERVAVEILPFWFVKNKKTAKRLRIVVAKFPAQFARKGSRGDAFWSRQSVEPIDFHAFTSVVTADCERRHSSSEFSRK